ncbi:30S ribosomal protein S2 [Candidatus Marinamargulisbacteria bacterium SCGC AAA071-K20]|nr:30S ribosomal protein S2 [Candidatus Marinamargulisbacteria bacterium SCGC AAA071-K20]
MRQLLECGVHFGHQTKRWNPKMKKYIFTSRNGIHVIDLQQSIVLIKEAYHFVTELVKSGGTVLFVGTKKQAQESIQSEAERCSMPYVQHRWLGGTLTNIATIRQSINKLKDLSRQIEDGSINELSNKEASKKTKKHTRLSYYLNGIKDMIQIPSAIFVIDTKKEQLAIQEARILNIPIIGIVDTNADPTEVDFPIPANDDAIRAVKLLCSIFANAVLDGQKLSSQESMKQAEEQMAKAALKTAEANQTTKVVTEDKKDNK